MPRLRRFYYLLFFLAIAIVLVAVLSLRGAVRRESGNAVFNTAGISPADISRNVSGPDSDKTGKNSKPKKLNDNIMKLTSPNFKNASDIPSEHTCDGANVSPVLKIEDPPADAKFFALIMDDPDSPSGNFLHWMAWNIPASVREIQESKLPESAQSGLNDFGKRGYGGPCPGSGRHRYVFRIYALKDSVFFVKDPNRSNLESAIQPLTLGRAELIGTYQRK